MDISSCKTRPNAGNPVPSMAVESCASNIACLVYVRYTCDMTENASGAENQQERLQPIPIELGHYLSGFADGEGSFNGSKNR